MKLLCGLFMQYPLGNGWWGESVAVHDNDALKIQQGVRRFVRAFSFNRVRSARGQLTADV